MATVSLASQHSQPPVGPNTCVVDQAQSSTNSYHQHSPISDSHRPPPTRDSPSSPEKKKTKRSNNQTSHVKSPQSNPNSRASQSQSSQQQFQSSLGKDFEKDTTRDDKHPQSHQAIGPPLSPPPRTSSQPKHQSNQISEDSRGQRASIAAKKQGIDIVSTTSAPKNPHDTTVGSRGRDQEAPFLGTPHQSSTTDQQQIMSSEGRSSEKLGKAPRDERMSYAAPTTKGHAHTVPDASGRRHQNDGGQVISRVIVDDPSIDLHREAARQMESIPTPRVIADSSTRITSMQTPRSRQEQSGQAASASGKRKETTFGEYVLGQTLGEGEFGKVKLGWKRDGSVQVAIKLIRRESLGSNPSRLPKINREIKILETLQHPNIVKLHEMVETSQYIGIILEYASGGELFDYILTHRFLKDNTARKLFAQLVSGVGYLHKKGIVHRDLKLENLLLDRNRNIIITDFGFANTFDPRDELGDEIEYRLTDREFVKRMDLERIRNGTRRGDLMATSCGSPCYAAPELVVTDSLYTGRKVDVWSCGVILYAMLAGYLPFDDDPENPEGDNINQLYKYITTTPLTFPEYVTPHARDLLRRILVPDPRKRADLFEVARHSWLSDFAHVVAQVTSSATTLGDIAHTTIPSTQAREVPGLVRSHSVREPAKTAVTSASPVGGLGHTNKIDRSDYSERVEPARDPKRRTVQVEYVPPQKQTTRGELSSPTNPGSLSGLNFGPNAGRTRGEGDILASTSTSYPTTLKPLPQDPRSKPDKSRYSKSAHVGYRAPNDDVGHTTRIHPEMLRSVSDSPHAFNYNASRPATGGSVVTSSNVARLPSRGNSYGQPLAPTLAATTAQGKVSQPNALQKHGASSPFPSPEVQHTDDTSSRFRIQSYAPNGSPQPQETYGRTHRRSNTLGNFFRTNSISGSRSQVPTTHDSILRDKRYPPTSMKSSAQYESTPRQSVDARRPSFSFNRKLKDTLDSSKQDKSRRFSLLPASFSFKGFASVSGGKDGSLDTRPASEHKSLSSQEVSSASQPRRRPQTMGFQGTRDRQRNTGAKDDDFGGITERLGDSSRPYSSDQQTRRSRGQMNSEVPQSTPPVRQNVADSALNEDLESAPPVASPDATHYQPVYPPGFGTEPQANDPAGSTSQSRLARGPTVLTKTNRRFVDAYDQDNEFGSGVGHHAGSSGAAKRVMDFFRRRGKARVGDDRV